MCNYICKEFRDTITQSLKDAQGADGSTTWVFSSMSITLTRHHAWLIVQTTMSFDMLLDMVSPTLLRKAVCHSLLSVENTSSLAEPSPNATLTKVYKGLELLH
jgi:ABC-type maltose transport system permease subunit